MDLKKFYGKNYDKVMTESKKERQKLKDGFLKTYPNADVSKFEFQVSYNADGTLDEKTIFFKVDDSTSYDVESDAFKRNAAWTWYLYQWEKIWSENGSVQPLEIQPKFILIPFKIHVTDTEYFTSEFPNLDTAWRGSPYVTDVKFDYENDPYFASMLAMYVVTYLCGISAKHLRSSGILGSLARYHVYFHTRRFLRVPEKLGKYASEDRLKSLRKLMPVRKTWERRFDQSVANLGTWRAARTDKPRIGAVSYARNASRQIAGIYYEYMTGSAPESETDFLRFIPEGSNGLTALGLKLFQQSVESYVYSILGAQAKTRWPIVGQGAKSLQTQDVFHKLSADTVAQDDATVAIANMRKAIKDTNVQLDFAISPGLVLIPSRMIILKEKLPGYNNVLLTAVRKSMTFGKNVGMNYKEPKVDLKTPVSNLKDTLKVPVRSIFNMPYRRPYNSLAYLLGISFASGAFVVFKLLI